MEGREEHVFLEELLSKLWPGCQVESVRIVSRRMECTTALRLGDHVCRRAEAPRISQEPGEKDESRAGEWAEGEDGPEASSARPAAAPGEVEGSELTWKSTDGLRE